MWAWNLQTNDNFSLLIVTRSCLYELTCELTGYSWIIRKPLLFGGVLARIKWHTCGHTRWWLSNPLYFPTTVIVGDLWLTREPLANRSFLVITDLNKLSELNAKACFTLPSLKGGCREGFAELGDERALFSVEPALWMKYVWKWSRLQFIVICVALLIPSWPSLAPELSQCWVMIIQVEIVGKAYHACTMHGDARISFSFIAKQSACLQKNLQKCTGRKTFPL